MHLPQGGVMSFHKEKADEMGKILNATCSKQRFKQRMHSVNIFYTVVQFANKL